MVAIIACVRDPRDRTSRTLFSISSIAGHSGSGPYLRMPRIRHHRSTDGTSHRRLHDLAKMCGLAQARALDGEEN